MGVAPIVVVFLAVDVLAAVVFTHLYRAERAPYLRWWALSFATLFVAQSAGAPALAGVQLPALQALGLPLIVVSTLLMVRGTTELAGVRWRAWWVVAGIGAFGLAIVALANGASFAVSAGAPMLFLASAWVGMGLAVWRSPSRPPGLGAGLTLVASVLAAVHYADFPFLGDVPWFAPWGMALAAFNEVAVCLGFLMLHSERSRAARAQAETQLRDLAETVGVAPLELSAEGRLTAASPTLVRLLGYEREADVLAADLEHEPPGVDLTQRVDANDVLPGIELRWKRRDGKRLVLQLHARARREQGRVRGYSGFVVDRTAAVALEERALHAQKVDVVGQLAGGIAHDFNNLLTVILSAHDLLRPTLMAADQEVLRDATEAATQAAHLTRRLLAFGRKQPFHAQVFDVAAVVRRTASMLERSLAPRHRLDLSAVTGPFQVKMDPGHLEQVLVNLVLNARDAMADEGVVTLSLRATPKAERAGVELTVVDHGRGMDADEQRRLFEPFFTTKTSGRGSGLGLPTVQSIVQQAGGAISVESEKGRGSRFVVWLPTVDAPTTSASAPLAHAPLPRGLRVLVVDDEAGIRRILVRVLEGAGCVTAEAASGPEVVRRFEAGERYDLVLSDVRMPGGDGPEAARVVRGLAPGTRIILMSGFTDRLDQQELPVADAFLGKPFSNEELLSCVRGVVARS